MISKDTRLRHELVKFVKAHPEVVDIVLFGSVVRGKEKPGDIDVLVIFRDKVDKEVEYSIRKKVEKAYANVSVISKTGEGVMDESFDARESVLVEGKSLVTGKDLAGGYGLVSFGMFKYHFKGWDKLRKTKFYYALNGRGGKEGIADSLGCIKLSDSVMLVPLAEVEEFREFLESWGGLEYVYIPTMIPERLAKRRVLSF